MNPTPTQPPDGLSPNDTAPSLGQRLDAIAHLLHRAARVVWTHADREGPRSPLHSLALGIHVAQGQVRQLRPREGSAGTDPPDATPPDLDLDLGPSPDRDGELDLDIEAGLNQGHAPGLDTVGPRTAVQLLTAAATLSRPLARRADLGQGGQLMDDLGDLIREARHHGC